MAVATSTALLIAAGTAAATTAYTTETAKEARKDAEAGARTRTAAAKLTAENKDKANRAGALKNRRQKIAGFQRNQTTFSGLAGTAQTQRKTLTGS